MNAGIVIGLIILLTLLNVPISFALIGGVVAALVLGGGTTLAVIPLQLFSGAAKFPLLAIPLFILAGGMMNSSGISLRIINLASALVGHVRGGLAMVNVADSMFFAEISGSAVADVAALGSIIIPAMVQKGYKPAFTAAVTSVTASLAIIIPPSIPMILYAVISGTSVTRLFLTGFAPGLIGGLLMMAVVYYKARKYGFPVEEAFSLHRLGRAFRDAGWTLALPVIILGGMFGGIVTATEAAGLAVLAAFIIGTFIYREMKFRQLWSVTLDGVVQTATVMMIVAASAVLGWYLTNEQIPQKFAEIVLGFTTDRVLVLLFLNIFLLIAGMFLHSAAAILLIVPIVMPLVRQVGVDPTHFGIIVTLNLAIGQQTPPVSSVLLTACAVAKQPVGKVFREAIPFIGVLLIVLAIVTYIPAIPLFLPELLQGP
ncbi:MAG: TRAP transporter large permease [Armatimonadetes bacterium]|nr:TRAP transporter large permease [Armatimonadota bacterium]MBI2973107.1 TRAP transporter large permease [Armatimonadota bacterium]